MTLSASSPKRGRPGYDAEEMLRIVVDVFTDYGYSGATMEIIARRLGLSKSAVYHHFDSKAAILNHALDRVLGALEAIFDAPGAKEGTGLDRMRFTIRGAVEIACEQRTYLSLLLRLRGHSEGEQAALNRRRELDKKLALLFDLAQAEGSLRSDVSARLMERFTFGLINSIVDWYRPGGELDPGQVADLVLEMMENGLVAASRASTFHPAPGVHPPTAAGNLDTRVKTS